MPRPGPANTKLQRWIDVVAALLARQLPVTFERLCDDVPAYAGKMHAIVAARDAGNTEKEATLWESLKRTFERDKDELRQLGVPLESLDTKDSGEEGRYRIRRADFYLPYLCVAAPDGRRTSPKRPHRQGYQALRELTFTADELQAVVDAGIALRELGDPMLLASGQSALRKLAADLPLDGARSHEDEPRLARVRAAAEPATFATLADALRRRKVVEFTYQSLSSGTTGTRHIEPWGLFFVSGHWYLTARDRDRGAQRNFRLNRVSELEVNQTPHGSPDYAIPGDFDLRKHAHARHPWELGDATDEEVKVAFHGDDGALIAARTLGTTVDADERERRFTVRRQDAFVRWLLSFAGGAVPEAGVVADRMREVLVSTRALYDQASLPDAARPPSPPLPQSMRTAFQAATAADQFQRLLALVPLIVEGGPHPLPAIAHTLGTTVETLERDLHALVERYDTPGGFVEGVQLYLEPEGVSVRTNHFHRPMRLNLPELCALELGLAMLTARRPPDEHGPMIMARERLRSVIAQLPPEALPNGIQDMAIAPLALTDIVATLRRCIRERRVLRLAYRRSGGSTPEQRHVRPHALVLASGALYLVAWCEERQALRHFRLDRIESAIPTVRTFEPDPSVNADTILASGRAFSGVADRTMRVRYSARVAPWIAEREGRQRESDGTLVLDHPVADVEWGLRHVLQYGAEAEVLSPPEMRERLRARIDQMLERLPA